MVLSACVYDAAAYTHTHGCLRLAGAVKGLRLHLHTLASPELLFTGMGKNPGVLMTSPRSSFWIDHSLYIMAGCCIMSRQTWNFFPDMVLEHWATLFFPLYIWYLKCTQYICDYRIFLMQSLKQSSLLPHNVLLFLLTLRGRLKLFENQRL